MPNTSNSLSTRELLIKPVITDIPVKLNEIYLRLEEELGKVINNFYFRRELIVKNMSELDIEIECKKELEEYNFKIDQVTAKMADYINKIQDIKF